MSGAFNLIYDSVISKKNDKLVYWIPELWVTSDKVKILERKDKFVRVEPYSYLKAQLDEIVKARDKDTDYHGSLSKVLDLSEKNGKIIDGDVQRLPGDWFAMSSIYGFYVRSFTAFDHNLDGELGGSKADITLNSEGLRETGTFLKSMALLPYVKSLGFDTVYMLPIALTGTANKKGELGSPYGLRNPFKINPMYHDPLVDEFSVETEFKAFVEAAHVLGLRIVLDIVPRITSRDSDWIKDNPDWFYWIDRTADANYHSPEFTRDELNEIHHRVNHIHDTKEKHMIPPHKDYIDLFNPPPNAEDVKHVDEQTGYVGKVGGKEVVVPGAFADWPPDDIQPAWTDVTYLKLYEDKDFNYVAYNTVRMYDGRIHEENKVLWDMIANVIPYYQEEFGLDGARIDMGHALPHKLEKLIIEKAREVDPDFGFLAEDFNVWAPARKNGYNVVMGNSWFTLCRTMTPSDNGDSFAKLFVKRLTEYPSPVLGSPETADTPRAAFRKGGVKFSKAVWTMVNILPNTVPFVTAGFELGDSRPTNLGLDFTQEEIATLSKKPLAFFDRAALTWDSPFSKEMIEHVTTMNKLREENKGNILHLDNFSWIESDVEGEPSMSPHNPVIAFMRVFHDEAMNIVTNGIFGEALMPYDIEKNLLVVVNMDCENEVIASLRMSDKFKFFDVFSKVEYKAVNGELNLKLKPGESVVAVSL